MHHTEKFTMWGWMAHILAVYQPPYEYRDALKMLATLMHLFDNTRMWTTSMPHACGCVIIRNIKTVNQQHLSSNHSLPSPHRKIL